MDCTEIRPLISYYYDGEATPEERIRVERHLAGCEDCRRVLAEYRAISGDLRDMAVPAPPVGLRRDVWRAIEAQQASVGARVFGAPQTGTSKRKQADQGKVVQFPQNRSRTGLAGVFATVESGWSRALTAALVIGALFITLGVLMVLQRSNTLAAAEITDQSPFSDYGQVVHVQFNKTVNSDDVKPNTQLYRLDGSTKITVTDETTREFSATATGGILSITPLKPWQPGASYEILIDSPRIHKSGVSQPFGDEPLALAFETMAYTPTPTSTPTETTVPTDTPVPTKQPTAVAEDTAVATPIVPVVEPSSTPVVEASATSVQPKPSNTPKPNPTATHVPPTQTPVPPVPPSATPTHEPEPTATAVVSATPTPHVGTPTATSTSTPPRGTPTPRPPCNTMPVNGFGKVWNEQPEVRTRIGCPTEYETAIQEAAQERFQGGYMFWRGDTDMIYVFLWGSPNDTIGTWQQFPNTWHEGDPEPSQTPAPSGEHQDDSTTSAALLGQSRRNHTASAARARHGHL